MDEGKIDFIEREVTKAELDMGNKGFDDYMAKFGNPPLNQKKYIVVIFDDANFIGFASGVTNDNGKCFYLSDLFFSEKYLRCCLGAKALKMLEKKIAGEGVLYVLTWTSIESLEFYEEQDYKPFF